MRWSVCLVLLVSPVCVGLDAVAGDRENADAVRCRFEGDEPVREVVGPCTRTTHEVTVRHPQLPAFPVEAQTLICGELEIDPWKRLQRDALEACDMALDFPTLAEHYYMQETLEVLGTHDTLVSVEHLRSGFTGGAHGWASLTVATWDTATGKQVTLAELLPDHAEAIDQQLRPRFDADPDAELYAYDLDAFAIIESSWGPPSLRFVMTNAAEVARGTTLTFDVELPEGASLD